VHKANILWVLINCTVNIHGCAVCCCCVQGEAPGEHILILCNAIGSPVDSKVIELEPKFVTVTGARAEMLFNMLTHCHSEAWGLPCHHQKARCFAGVCMDVLPG
jgi:hypothetical protein